MAITILYGPGGSGKSLFQMHIILEELRESRRNIVTNLALDIPKLAAYLEKAYPGENLNPAARIRILTPEEVFEFWKHRGPYLWTGNEYDQKEDSGEWGVAFVIDEAGASGFDATGWASSSGRTPRGVQCSWYLDQQRKFSDNVYASTNGRNPSQIAKPFRDKAHYFVRLKNGYLAKFGAFRGSPKFTYQRFTHEPAANSEPMAVGTFKLDGMADCYRTQDGMGISGKNADKGARAKGLPLWTAVPMIIAALILGLVGVPALFGRAIAGYFAPAPAAVAKPSPPAQAAPAVPVAPTIPGLPPVVPAVASLPPAALPGAPAFSGPPEPRLVCTGVLWSDTEAQVCMSDGAIETSSSGLQSIERGRVKVRGEWFPLRSAVAQVSPPVVVQASPVSSAPVPVVVAAAEVDDGAGAWRVSRGGVELLRDSPDLKLGGR